MPHGYVFSKRRVHERLGRLEYRHLGFRHRPALRFYRRYVCPVGDGHAQASPVFAAVNVFSNVIGDLLRQVGLRRAESFHHVTFRV